MAPNIVFFLIDDLGWRDLACSGSDFYETPNLDRLAREGVQFTRAYASCPVCSPSRASIMTGQYPARVGITQWIGGNVNGSLLDVPYLHYLPTSHTSLATALREGGYQTWHVGKWHLGSEAYYPQHHGFDVNIAGNDRGHPPGPNGYWSPYSLSNFVGTTPGEYLTDRLTDEALALIDRRDASKPFFLNFWHYAVHTPIQAPQHLIDKYVAKAKRLGLDQIDPIEVGERIEIEYAPGQGPWHVRRRKLQSDPAYAAMIENLDANIGRVLDKLREQNLERDTIIIFTSDNGGLATAEGSPTCNLPLAEGKGWVYEGGNRVAQLIRWPARIAPTQTCAVPVTSTDFYPTLLEAAGLPARPQQHVDGVSLMPLMTGGAIERDAIYWHYPHYSNQGGTPAAAVVAGNWKLIRLFEGDAIELYDLGTDPGEHDNLADREPARRKQLEAMLNAWLDEVTAKIPAMNPRWKPRLSHNSARAGRGLVE